MQSSDLGYFAISLVCSILVVWAANKRRDSRIWMFLAFLVPPFVLGAIYLFRIFWKSPDADRPPVWSKAQAAMVVMLAITISGTSIAFGMGLFSIEGFSDEDIQGAKRSIKAEFEKQAGTHVSEVTLIRETNRKLTGFAKIKIDGVSAELTKACEATYGTSQYVWNCR